MESKKYQLNEEELKKWLYNAGIFLAPALLLFLTAIQSGKSIQDAALILQGWALNSAVDLTRKFIAGK